MHKIGQYYIHFGTYASGDYSPHFAWSRLFKCIPFVFGNLYIIRFVRAEEMPL